MSCDCLVLQLYIHCYFRKLIQFTKFQGHRAANDVIGGAYSAAGGNEKCVKIFGWKARIEETSVGLGGRIIY